MGKSSGNTLHQRVLLNYGSFLQAYALKQVIIATKKEAD